MFLLQSCLSLYSPQCLSCHSHALKSLVNLSNEWKEGNINTTNHCGALGNLVRVAYAKQTSLHVRARLLGPQGHGMHACMHVVCPINRKGKIYFLLQEPVCFGLPPFWQPSPVSILDREVRCCIPPHARYLYHFKSQSWQIVGRENSFSSTSIIPLCTLPLWVHTHARAHTHTLH